MRNESIKIRKIKLLRLLCQLMWYLRFLYCSGLFCLLFVCVGCDHRTWSHWMTLPQ